MLNPLVRAPQPADLAAPVGTTMRPTLTIETGDSLARGAQTLRENGGTVLPVVDETGRLQGVLSDAGLARALAEASEATDAVGLFLDRPETIAPYASGADALRRTEYGGTLVVVDDTRRVVGLVSAVDLWPRRRALPRPAMVGGMATPFGVYLTSGNVSAGAPWWALAATGATMFSMLLVGIVAATLAHERGLTFVAQYYLAGAVFFALMRLVPLSGIHGAEHQVVHAIERGEALVPEVVRRMPLVHPRCGTNLMVGLTLFLAISTVPGIGTENALLLGALVAVAFAMPLGALAQRFITTRRPTEAQLASAIQAGEALLLANATAHAAKPTPLRRIWSMGVLQVVAGATAASFVVAAVKAATHASWLPDIR